MRVKARKSGGRTVLQSNLNLDLHHLRWLLDVCGVVERAATGEFAGECISL